MKDQIKLLFVKQKILLTAVILLLICCIFFLSSFFSPTLKTQSFDFEIFLNEPTHQIINNLYQKKIIRNKFIFKVLLALKGNSKKIKKGVFTLHRKMTANQIINIITSGRVKSKKLTIPEGFNNRQIGDVLVKLGFFDSRNDFFDYTSNVELLNEYNIPAASIEGYIFPDTYSLPIGYPKKKIIRYFLDNFLKKTQNLKDFPINIKKRHALITLASIVEREAKLKEEIALIAGVFEKRLKKNYPLESCATIQYLLKKPRERLYYRDLKIKSPYNTYRNSGLPPAPISNPGLRAIQSTLHPQKTDYMFFVTRGDGGHIFSKTLSAHNKAKKNMRLFGG